MNQTIYEKLATLTDKQNIKINEPLNHYTFTKTGGHADYLVTPVDYEEVKNVCQFAKENNIAIDEKATKPVIIEAIEAALK